MLATVLGHENTSKEELNTLQNCVSFLLFLFMLKQFNGIQYILKIFVYRNKTSY